MTTTSAMLKPTVEGSHTTAATSSKKAGMKTAFSRSCEEKKLQHVEQEGRDHHHPEPSTFSRSWSFLVRTVVENSSRRTVMVHLL